MIVVQLLNLLFGVLFFVLGDVLRLLDLTDGVGTRVTDRHPALFGELVDDLHQLPPSLFVERGERDPDEVAVVGRGESQIGREDRLFHRLRRWKRRSSRPIWDSPRPTTATSSGSRSPRSTKSDGGSW